MRLLWLPAACRDAGLKVVEVRGWQNRGRPFMDPPRVVIGHHTATSARATGDLPTRDVLVNGREDLPGPLCQVGLGRSGTVYVIAAGKANHAGRGHWRGISSSARTVGIEAEHPGSGQWPPRQLAAFDLLAAVLLDRLGQTADSYCGHREWALPAGRKVDPGGIDLDRQRARIHALLNPPRKTTPAKPTPAPAPAPAPAPLLLEEDDMAKLVTADGQKVFVATARHGARHVRDQVELGALRASGLVPMDEKPTRISQAQLDALLAAAQ